MSMRTLELAILKGARLLLCNPKLKMKDIPVWSTSQNAVTEDLSDGEVMYYLADPGVYFAVESKKDLSDS